MTGQPRILLLSAYDAMSHRQWRTALVEMLPRIQWTQLTLPPRHFNWRVRGNSLSWAFSKADSLRKPYDLIIATSLVDLSSLRGFVPELAGVPTLVYFHENQFAYPVSSWQAGRQYSGSLDAAMVSLYTALCADHLVFNSDYNRQTFLNGISGLLRTLPDHVPGDLMSRLPGTSVIPVPVATELQISPNTATGSPEVLTVAWNHRWEYDKGTDLLLNVVQQTLNRGLPVSFQIMGQQFRRQPAEFRQIQKLLEIDTGKNRNPGSQPHPIGFVPDRAEYLSRLAASDVVLSTSRHDFQGLSIIEGAALGCTPLCPNDLVYPEYLESQFLYCRSEDGAIEKTAENIVTRLAGWQRQKAQGNALPKFNPVQFSPSALKESYLALIKTLAK